MYKAAKQIHNPPSAGLSVEDAVKEIAACHAAIAELYSEIANQRGWISRYHRQAQRNACGQPTTVEVDGQRRYWHPDNDGQISRVRN